MSDRISDVLLQRAQPHRIRRPRRKHIIAAECSSQRQFTIHDARPDVIEA